MNKPNSIDQSETASLLFLIHKCYWINGYDF